MISVIVPVYNVERYLRECVDSILSQTYEDFEVLLVDDGSTDNSGAICDEYSLRDSRVLVIHKPNGGLSSARNCGIDNARGEWIIFIDSDDVWSSDEALSSLIEYSERFDLDILRFEYQAVDEYLTLIETRVYNKNNISNRVISNYELVKYGIAGEWFAVLYLIRREILMSFRFDETVRFQEDIDFYCRLFAQCNMRCGYLDEKFYLYRKHTASITTTPKIENLRCSFNLGETFYTQSTNTSHDKLRQLYQYYSVMMYYWTLNTVTEPPYSHNMPEVIGQLGLERFHKKVMDRVKSCNIEIKHYIFIVLPPIYGAKFLKFKNRLVIASRKIWNLW